MLARRDTLAYRAGKFIRRNTAASVAAALVVLSLVGGIVMTSWQAQRAREQEAIAIAEKARAERRFNEVRQLARSVLFDYHDAIKDLSGATAIRERLVKDGLAYLDSLAREAGDDPELQRELAAAYDRVGDVRGRDLHRREPRRLRRRHGELYQGTENSRRRWWPPRPGDLQNQRELAFSYQKIGNAVDRDERGRARAWNICAKRLAIHEQLAADQPETRRSGRTWRSRTTRSAWRWKAPEILPALEVIHRKALALREALVAADPGNQKRRRSVVISDINLGRALFLKRRFPGRPCEQPEGARRSAKRWWPKVPAAPTSGACWPTRTRMTATTVRSFTTWTAH